VTLFARISDDVCNPPSPVPGEPVTDPITPRLRAAIPDAVLVRVLGDESVLLNLETESYFGLDAVGTRMWNAIATAPNLAAALAQLADEYEVERAELHRDLSALVRELAGAGLVRVLDV